MLLKTPTKNREFVPTLFVKTTDFQLVFNFEQTRKVTIFGKHDIKGSYTMMAKSIRALELHYPMIQCLKTSVMCPYRPCLHVFRTFLKTHLFVSGYTYPVFQYALIPESCGC